MNVTTPLIVSFARPVTPQEIQPDAERILSGSPQHTVWNHYADPSNQFFAGVWSSTRGKWRVRYTEHEFCYLKSGAVVVTSEAGQSWEFWAGDTFVIPAGFRGTWEVVEDCTKLYATFEPR